MILRNIFRSYLKKGRNNLIKILSLGVGLAMGLVLIAKVYFEQSYDDFFPDKERIYQVHSNYKTLEGDKDLWNLPGAVVVGMKEMIPAVEVATRWTGMSVDGVFYTQDKKKVKSEVILGDSCLFDVFPLDILAGNPKEVLARPMYVMVSREVAENMGGVEQAVGQTFTFDEAPGRTLTVGGVFEDLPKNSHLSYTMVVSMPSIAEFMHDGSMNWVGNDRYHGYVKLLPGTDPATLRPYVEAMREKYLPLDRLKESGVDINYLFYQLLEVHAGTPEVKGMVLLLSLLAFALLFTAVMNYVLIVISSLVNRSKEMAIYKCYGASGGNIRNRMLVETFVDLFVAVLVAVLIILSCRGVVVDLLGADVTDLFTGGSSLLLLTVCLCVFLLAGLIPGYLFARIPVAVVFQRATETRRFWKLGLLFFQFVAAALFTTLLFFIARQYQFMVNDNPGYAYENLAYCDLGGIDSGQRQRIVDEISRLPEVSRATTFSELPLHGASGNNIQLPGDDRSLFNISDQCWVGNGYLEMMEIPVVEGLPFREDVSSSDEVMVSRSFIEKILPYTDWKDGVVGKSIIVTMHSVDMKPFTICGVYEDFRVGTIGAIDPRSTVMFYNPQRAFRLLVKFNHLTPETLQKVSDALTTLSPGKNIELYSIAGETVDKYNDSRQFRDQVLLSGLATLLICLIGLIGYTNDEMSRRRKEVAIRKVNGATISNIERLFLTDISRMAIPAAILGAVTGYFVLVKWMENFTQKVSLSPVWFVICGLTVWLIILTVVAVNCYRAATENPAESVKSE